MDQTYILVDFENVQPPDMGLLSGDQYQLRIFRGPHQKKLDFDIAESLQPLGDRVKYIQSDRHGKNALDFHIAFYMGRLLEGLEANGSPATRNTRFVVISHDGGFDALISHVQSLGYAAAKAASIRHALGLDEPAAATESAMQSTPTQSPASASPVSPTPVKPPAAKKAAPAAKVQPTKPAATPEKAATAQAKPAKATGKKPQAPARKTLGAEDKEKVIEHLRLHPKNRPVKRKTLESHITSVLGSNVAAKAVQGLVAVLENEGIVNSKRTRLMSTRFPSARSRCGVVLFSGLLLGVVSVSLARADQQFYRCVVNGKTIYTDKPCDAPTLPGVMAPSASTSNNAAGQARKPTTAIELDYSTPYGVWRGQAQYQATVKGKAVREAHVVVPLVIEVEKQGRVRGASPENGCKLLGVAAPYAAPNMLTLDVTLSECSYAGLNRRYSGTLALYQSSNSVQFSLRSLNPMVAVLLEGPANFDIKATMKR